MWLAMLGAAYGFKTKSHFALVFIIERFEQRLRKFMGTLVTMIVSAFLVIFIIKSIEYLFSITTQIGPVTRMPMVVPYASAPAGGVLILCYVVKNWWTEIRRSPITSELA